MREFIVLVLFLSFFLAVAEATTYEAEDAVYFGVDNTERATASGGRCLRGFDAAGDYVDYQNVVAGNRLIVRYSNQLSNDSRCSLYLDGIDIGHVYFPSTGSWTVFATVVINIDISANTDIKLQIDADDFAYNNSQSCATQDKIDVISVTGHLDEIIFGNGISESFLHTTSFADTTSGTGALNESYRKCNNTDSSTSSMTFEMVCQPDVQNYLTLKFWGSDTLSSREFLYLFDGSTQIGSYGSDEPEIINWNDEPALPGCFVYVTYMIPTSMTGSNSSVTLKVAGSTLPIYKGYTHIDPFFEPVSEAQGSPSAFSGSRPAPGGETAVEYIQNQLELAIDRILTWQLYGEEWDTWVANGWGPEMMTGSINIHGVKNQGDTKDEYKLTWSQRQGSHVRAQQTVEVIALAYHASWSQYYHDPEMIDRVVKALDFLRVAQGSDGGFVELENESGRWCGGPNRTDGSGSLMGFGFKGPPAAFLAVYNEILAAGYLDPTETVDEDDNDATAEVTRKQAYINYFKGVRDNLTTPSNRGHASNQDIVGLFAAYLYDECLALLDPAQTWNSTEKQYYFDVCIGNEDGIYGGPWVSDKGTSMEGNGIARGGYCGGYGEHNHEHWMRMAHLSGDTEVRDYGLLAHEMMAKMRYTGYDASLYPVLRREGWNSWRHTNVPGADEPGKGVAMGAVLYNDPVCLRQTQLAEQYGQYYSLDLSAYWVHFESTSAYWMRQVDYIEQALALPDTDYRLPFEAGEPDFAWADEEAKLIVVKQGDIRFNVTMNWRHGLLNDVRHPDNSLANNKARVHYTDGEKDRRLTVGMRTPFGMHELYIWDFGEYSIGMNASPDTSYEFTLPAGHPTLALDLITGQVVDLTTNPTLAPRSTMILDFYQAQYCGDRNTQYLTSDFDIDCDVDLNDLADFADQWLNAYTMSDFSVMGSDWSPSGYDY